MSRIYFTDRDLGNQFPEILTAAGIAVERHREHFLPDCPDDEWLSEVGARGWIAVTHNSRIRYTPNELAAVMEHDVALLVVIGKAPYAELAQSFVRSYSRIESFVENHTPPYIAKVHRPSPSALARGANARGRVDLWHPLPDSDLP